MALAQETTYIIIGASLGFLLIIVLVIILVVCRGRVMGQCCRPGQAGLCDWRRTKVSRRTDYNNIQRDTPGRGILRSSVRIQDSLLPAAPGGGGASGGAGGGVHIPSMGSDQSMGSRTVLVMGGAEPADAPPAPRESRCGPRPASGPFVATVPLDGSVATSSNYCNHMQHGQCPCASSGGAHAPAPPRSQVFMPPAAAPPLGQVHNSNVARLHVDHVSQVQCQDVSRPGHFTVNAPSYQPQAQVAPRHVVTPPQPGIYPGLGTMMRNEGMNEIHIHATVPASQPVAAAQGVAPSNGLYPRLSPPAYTTLPR